MAVTQGSVGDVVDDGKNDGRSGEWESVSVAAAVKNDNSGEHAQKNQGVHDEDGAVEPEIGAEEVGEGALCAKPGGDDAGEEEF